MRHYIRINKQINLPLSLEAEDYLQEHLLRDDVIHWRDNYCVILNEYYKERLLEETKHQEMEQNQTDDLMDFFE